MAHTGHISFTNLMGLWPFSISYTILTIKWRKDFVGNFFVKKEGNAKYSSVTWSIPDALHGEMGRKVALFYTQFGISGYLKVQCKTDTLVDINKAWRHVPYLGLYAQPLKRYHV